MNKFKEQKGFTLVELLAVITILGIIVAIAVPSIGNVIDNAREDAEEIDEEMVIEAARLAHIQGEVDLDDVGDGSENGFLISTLKNEGYLDVDDTDAYSDDADYVEIDDNEYTYVND
ncbi:type IV pilus assembly protein PilA [Aquibacillus albus]|uniref:Type IV pilus assembly protein PilA n=2 Tax=Aquibacillus albus TaxID=1168171 RepID=A0ABS2N1M6_9BACI|nr:type IV pilus assembly protein PilA [Aquibacillus albus]